MTITDERALELLKEHFAEPQGWDWCSEYGEPGYDFDGDQQVIVFGDYWCRCGKHPHAGRPKHRFRADDPETFIEPGDLHSFDLHHPRLWARFEQVAEFAWRDEWLVDYENDKAYRTTGDCYGWQPSAVYTEHGDVLTPDDDAATWIEMLDIERNTIGLNARQVSLDALHELGFEFIPDDDTFYETGWHPGQTDDPHEVIAGFAEQFPDHQWIVWVSGVGQFDARWKILHRPTPTEDD